MRMNSFKNVTYLFFILLIATGCSSSRKYSRDPIYDTGKKERNEVKNGGNKRGDTPIWIPGSDLKLDASSKAIVEEARQWLGTRYAYGGHSKNGTDCSGFVMEVYRKAANIKLPRTTVEQREFSSDIDSRKMEVGDLVFFSSGKRRGKVSHVGLYIGDGQMIHASSSRGVIVSNLEETYYTNHYHSSGRVGEFADARKRNRRNSDGSRGERGKTTDLRNKSNKTPVSIVPAPPKRKEKKIKEIRLEELDEVLTQKSDSIYTNMFD